MRRVALFLILLVLTVFGNAAFADAPSMPTPEGIHWRSYSDAVFTEAKTRGQFILLYAGSATCHWCQQMNKTTWQTPEVIQLVETNFVPVKLDVDTQVNIAVRYQVASLPTMFVLDSNNRIIKIFSGYFSPEFMEKNLQAIIANDKPSAGNVQQPEVIKESVAPVSTVLLPDKARNDLSKKQLDIIGKPQAQGLENTDLDSVEYVLFVAAKDEKLAHARITAILNAYIAANDPVWGGIYNGAVNGSLDFSKRTSQQAHALEIFSKTYAYWHDPAYIAISKSLIAYISNFLTSPEGVFYTGQTAHTIDGKQDADYYKLDDQHRRQLGVPAVDKHIYTNDNGLVILGLADFYKMTGDKTVLDKAEKAAHWIAENFSLPEGGFRHEKTENNKIYLSDTLAMGDAFLRLYQATTDPEYLRHASDAARFINKYFQNAGGKPGFITMLDLTSDANEPSVLRADENAEMVRFTALLYSQTGDEELKKMAQSSFNYLMTPDSISKNPSAAILMAEFRMANRPMHVTVVGAKNDPAAASLFQAALANAAVYSRIDWWEPKAAPLQNSDVVYPVLDKAAAYVCSGFNCSFPIFAPADLSALIHSQILLTAASASMDNTPKKIGIFRIAFGVEELLVKRNWFVIVFGFMIFGLLLSFTPCILPLTPIMASIIVGPTIGARKQRTFFLCLAYVFAMSLTYAILGVLAGVFGLYLQIYMQQAWVITLFSLIFLMLALSMLDAYELQLPRTVLQKAHAWSNLQKGGNYYGVMVMGALSTIIVSPCVSAPLAGVLSYITRTGDYLLGAIGLFFMGMGIGIPLLIISLFSQDILPKVSKWNTQIKIVFGLISLALSIWIFSRIASQPVSMMLWAALIILTTLYMKIFKRKTKTLRAKLRKTLAILLFTFGIALFVNALFMNTALYHHLMSENHQSWINPDLGSAAIFKNVKKDSELGAALADATQKHLPILLDFSAQWCTSCMDMDRHVLNDVKLTPLLSKFILLRVDLTNIDSESMSLARKYNIAGPPVILFFDSQGKLDDARVVGAIDEKHLEEVLQQEITKEK